MALRREDLGKKPQLQVLENKICPYCGKVEYIYRNAIGQPQADSRNCCFQGLMHACQEYDHRHDKAWGGLN